MEQLEPQWRALWESDCRATPFQSPDWLIPWTRHLWGGGKLRLLVFYRGSSLAALAPLFQWGIESACLSFLGSGISDYLDLIAAPDFAPDAAQALLWCRRSLAIAPRYAPALYLRAQLLERRNDDGAAMAAAHAAIQAEPDWSAPHYLLARLLRRQGETAAASAEMQAVSRLQNTSPRSELANLLVALEEQP